MILPVKLSIKLLKRLVPHPGPLALLVWLYLTCYLPAGLVVWLVGRLLFDQ